MMGVFIVHYYAPLIWDSCRTSTRMNVFAWAVHGSVALQLSGFLQSCPLWSPRQPSAPVGSGRILTLVLLADFSLHLVSDWSRLHPGLVLPSQVLNASYTPRIAGLRWNRIRRKREFLKAQRSSHRTGTAHLNRCFLCVRFLIRHERGNQK